jgi:hypothetical protein
MINEPVFREARPEALPGRVRGRGYSRSPRFPPSPPLKIENQKTPMKNNIAGILLALSVIAAPLAAKADLIWYEDFQYPNGNLPTVSADTWITFSSFSGNMFVNNSNLEVSTTGNAVSSRSDDDRRPLAIAPGSPSTNTVQVLYASFTIICTNLPNGAGSYFASFYNPKSGSGGGYFGRIQAFTNGTMLPKTWRLGVTANNLSVNPADGGYPVDLALNTPYQVVEELDPVTLDAATIWINPVNVNQTGASPAGTHYTSNDSIGYATTVPVTDYAFRQAGSFGNGFWVITNLAVATTFAEAATNIWATNALPPVIVYQPLGVTNYVGSSFTLSAVANGQGLGNLTYQWQQGGTNYTGGDFGADSNVLSVSYALASDSGDFTLVTTTPYGLSVTSDVAKVLISAAAVPPAFKRQPGSQTVYQGQSATFSTTVVSPGNVTFTWYSNDVAVTAGQADNGYSSTYALNNVDTNFSATYKVAVTNDVVADGIVSTGAVLTVVSPPAVSIAYLRTLVDPNNGYATTNVPPTLVYQVTGTITTYTNLTTGNTCSYYLQDGTGGINLFATGASAFRPAQGDVVTWVGVLSSYATGLELYADPTGAYPYTSYTDTGATNALPAPIDIPFDVTSDLDHVNYNVAGSLVRLSDVYFGTNAGTAISTSANETITVTNASGESFRVEFFFLDQDTAGQVLPEYAYSVSGVLYGINTNFTVAVTRFADIATNPPPPPPTIIPTISAGITGFTIADGNAVITGTNAQTTGVYYLLASTNVALPLNQWTPVATNVVSTNGENGAFTFIGTNAVTPGGQQEFYILSNTNFNPQ